jgi:16S rRNA (uracil1498-N3)-methyltransferase
MALPFFYEEDISNKNASFTLSEETSKHCIQVLRMKQGEQLQLTDGKGNAFIASIITEDKKNCTVKIVETKSNPEHSRKLSIGISLLKNSHRFEWFLEKATEIGVIEIIPLICKRTEREHFRFDRMNAILIAAMLQSQQTWLPILHQPTDVNIIIQQSSNEQKLIAHCEDDVKNNIQDLSLHDNIQILIGPEGDFTMDEIQLAMQNQYQPVSLGSSRLRTETAGIVAAALLMNF